MFPDEIVTMINEVKKRRLLRFPLALENQKILEEFENEYPKDDLPWYWLSLIISNPKNPNESVIDRMMVPVWESNDPEIKLLWSFITRNDNIDNLIRRCKSGNLNGHAKKVTEMAIQIIESRT